ncbi:MAG: NACHT domain-containing protein [Cyclobacteriaceae bacterium]
MEEITEKLLKTAVELTLESLSSLTSGWDSKLRSKFKGSFKTYTEETCKHCSAVYNLINKNNPANLTDIYVEPPFYFYTDKKEYTSFKKFNPFEKHNKILIKGTAGLGKSTLCKHLYLHFVQKNEGIPLFMELKHINNTKLTLWEFILNELKLTGVNINSEHISDLFKSGKFILILDGFDEVDPEIRHRLEIQLRELLKECRKLKIMISSRPDERLATWDNFRIIKLLPFTKDKSIELISKIDFNEEIKKNFTVLIGTEDIYSKFKSFLSNPLLTTIMFITYDEFGYNTLSDKMNIFYERAFEALLVRHDSTKSQFHRKFASNLNPYDIKIVAEAFSIQSYVDRAFAFSESQTVEYIKKSKKLTKLDFETEFMLTDLTRSVCLLHLDGLNYTFTHRSFQEYLSAVYLSKLEHEYRRTLLNNVLKNIETDNVIELLYSINHQLVIREIAIPLFQEAVDEFPKFQESGKHTEALLRFYGEFKIIKGPNYKLIYRNPNPRIKLLKLIAHHSKPIKDLLSKFPTSVDLNGNKEVLDSLMNLPSEHGRKTFNLQIISAEKTLEMKPFRSQETLNDVFRIYKSCLLHFNTEIQNTNDRIFEYLIK